MTEKMSIQTDEWPMRTMKTGPFNNQSPLIQVSLRCMDNKNNVAGSNQVMDFRRCRGPYKPKGSYESKKLVTSDRPLAHLRQAPINKKTGLKECEDPDEDDTYIVTFNFDNFDMNKEEDVNLRKQVRTLMDGKRSMTNSMYS